MIKTKAFTHLNFSPKIFGGCSRERSRIGFTIVELLVVIVVIGILAAITIVAYTGISSKAITASLQSDLTNAKKQLALYYVDNGAYPASISSNCPVGPDDPRYCLKPSSGNTLTYSSISPYSTYSLTNINTNSTAIYNITNDSAPTVIPTVTIGSQTWMQYNLDVGVMINTNTTPNQTSNLFVEKYCYNNDPANCTTYGGLYQWDEMMQYVTTEGAQGIAPAGFHIPTDAEVKTLEMSLGMNQAQADALAWRGTDQGTQLKIGGLSGFSGLLGGYYASGSFLGIASLGYYWSSSQYNTPSAWLRHISSASAQVYRYPDGAYHLKTTGFSVRAIKN